MNSDVFNNLSNARGTIFIKTDKGDTILEICNILYCENYGNYTKFYQEASPTIIGYGCIKKYTEILEPYGFIRIHAKYLVNAWHIRNFIRTATPPAIVLYNGERLDLSRRKKINSYKKWKGLVIDKNITAGL